MARPMLLIQKDLLIELHDKHIKGVPVSRLIKDHNLDITSPTLSKLLTHFEASEKAKEQNSKDLILASLFPPWLGESNKDIVLQPQDWVYHGRMPLGEWEWRG